MSFGDTSRGFSRWSLDDAGAEPIFRQALGWDHLLGHRASHPRADATGRPRIGVGVQL
jgi:hypothetical protein